MFYFAYLFVLSFGQLLLEATPLGFPCSLDSRVFKYCTVNVVNQGVAPRSWPSGTGWICINNLLRSQRALNIGRLFLQSASVSLVRTILQNGYYGVKFIQRIRTPDLLSGWHKTVASCRLKIWATSKLVSWGNQEEGARRHRLLISSSWNHILTSQHQRWNLRGKPKLNGWRQRGELLARKEALWVDSVLMKIDSCLTNYLSNGHLAEAI